MVLNRSRNIYNIIEAPSNEVQINEVQANDVDTNPPNVIVNPPVPVFNSFLHFLMFVAPYLNGDYTDCTYSTDCPNCINRNDGTHCLTMEGEYLNSGWYPIPNHALEEALENAYDEYYIAETYWNDLTYDLRKKATRNREKKITKRQKCCQAH